VKGFSGKKTTGARKALKLLETKIKERFDRRLEEIKLIGKTYPGDALRHLNAMQEAFAGYPDKGALEGLRETLMQ